MSASLRLITPASRRYVPAAVGAPRSVNAPAILAVDAGVHLVIEGPRRRRAPKPCSDHVSVAVGLLHPERALPFDLADAVQMTYQVVVHPNGTHSTLSLDSEDETLTEHAQRIADVLREMVPGGPDRTIVVQLVRYESSLTDSVAFATARLEPYGAQDGGAATA